METMPQRFPLPELEREGDEEMEKSLSVTKSRCELAARQGVNQKAKTRRKQRGVRTGEKFLDGVRKSAGWEYNVYCTSDDTDVPVGGMRHGPYLDIYRHHLSARRAPMLVSMTDSDGNGTAQTLICAINWYTGVESIWLLCEGTTI